MASKPVYLLIHTHRVNWVAARIWDCSTNCWWRKNFTPVRFFQLESHFNTAAQKECWRECDKQLYKLHYLSIKIAIGYLLDIWSSLYSQVFLNGNSDCFFYVFHHFILLCPLSIVSTISLWVLYFPFVQLSVLK